MAFFEEAQKSQLDGKNLKGSALALALAEGTHSYVATASGLTEFVQNAQQPVSSSPKA